MTRKQREANARRALAAGRRPRQARSEAPGADPVEVAAGARARAPEAFDDVAEPRAIGEREA